MIGNKGGRKPGFKMPEEHRSKLKVSQLLNRLQDCALGKVQLRPDEVRCLEISLKKALPDLSAQEITGDVTQYVARLPQPAASVEAWTAATTPPKLEDKTKH
jgi:hypothetical protein